MNPSLITTKLAPPRRARQTLSRPRLERLIQPLADTTLALVKAPPGFGKTTLITAWADAARTAGAVVAWLTLDEHDDDVERLLLYITAAVRRALQAPSATLQNLALLPREQLLSQLLQELEQCPAQVYLFLDDCHCVPPPLFEAAVAPLVRYAPHNLHLVLCGRSDLPGAINQSLYGDAALQLGAAQLRFTLEETCQLVATDSPTALRDNDARTLHQSTDGWIAGLRARLLLMRQTPDAPVPAGLSVDTLFDSLLSQLPEALLNQLLPLSVVEQFSAELAGELGTGDGKALIQQLDQQQLFVSSLDESGTWYGLHPLFREHLREHLLKRQGATRQAQIRAAHWFAAQQLWTQAVRCALAAGQKQEALGWIAECAMQLVEQGDFIQLLDWQRHLQDRLIEAPLQLQLALAWACGLAMLGERSLQLIETAHSDLGKGLDKSDLKWECLALRAMLLALQDRSAEGARLARECMPHLGARPWICNVLFNVIGFGDMQSRDWKGFYNLPPALPVPQRSTRHLVTLTYRHCLVALGEIVQGRLSPAATLLQESMRQATPGVGAQELYSSPVLRGLPAALLSYIYYQEGRYEEARLLNLENQQIIRQAGFLDCMALGTISACRLALRQADNLSARALLDEAENLAQSRNWPRLSGQILLERTRLALLENNVIEANACAVQLQQMLPSLPNVASNHGLASLAQLWCAAGDTGAPIDRALIEDDLLALRSEHATLRLSELLIAQAVLQEDAEAASAVLLEAHRLLEQSGASQTLLDYPFKARLAATLQSCMDLQTLTRRQHEQLGTLLSKLQQDGQLKPAPSYDLTSKEREILDRVADGKSNKEIARDLGVAPETIKSHMKSIFQKLDVSSRTQAAMKMREEQPPV